MFYCYERASRSLLLFDLSPAPRMDTGYPVYPGYPGYPEVDDPNSQYGHCPRGMDVTSLTSHWHHSLVAGFRVWRGEGGDVIPQIARLGILAVLHMLTVGSGSGTLLTSLSRFNLAPGPGFPRHRSGTTTA